jgi:6-phosphogluconolactonase
MLFGGAMGDAPTTSQSGSERPFDVSVLPNPEALMRAEAEHSITLAREAIAARGRFDLALAGGSTPRRLYELFSEPDYIDRIDWSRVHVFWGDERCVSPNDPRSNYRMVRESLLDCVPIPEDNIHRIRGEYEPHRAAEAYEQELRVLFGRPQGPPERSFDQVLLGMGPDGHTASLFPGTPAVTETQRWVVAQHVEQPLPMWRITLTPVVLNAAADVTFLVAGAGKAERLRQVLGDEPREEVLPAQLIRPKGGQLHWMADAAAGALLRTKA